MQTFTYYLTLQVSGMNDESAENKLDKFLSSLELKKNKDIVLTSLEIDDGEGEIDMSDEPEEEKKAPAKKSRPALRLPKNASSEWDEDYEDADWDTLEEKKEPVTLTALDLEDEGEESSDDGDDEDDDDDWDWDDEEGDWEDDEEEGDDIDGILKGLGS